MAMDPVVKVVTVPVGPDRAFRRFTAEIDSWWPRSTHSVFQGACAAVRMEGRMGGRVYEVSDDGEESEWGRITAWDPPRRVAFTWHPGRSGDTSQHVEALFRPAEGSTEVRIEHGGWERLGDDAVETRGQYDHGWETVLGRYTDSLGTTP